MLARLVIEDECKLMDYLMQDQQAKLAFEAGFSAGFSGFVGIDWSGAKTQFIAGIQLAAGRLAGRLAGWLAGQLAS